MQQPEPLPGMAGFVNGIEPAHLTPIADDARTARGYDAEGNVRRRLAAHWRYWPVPPPPDGYQMMFPTMTEQVQAAIVAYEQRHGHLPAAIYISGYDWLDNWHGDWSNPDWRMLLFIAASVKPGHFELYPQLEDKPCGQ